MKRLFAFGCSFTQYYWPTWADIMGSQFDYYENWGKTGGGNQYIVNSLVECNLKNQISKDDLVVIMWTNVCRLDSYKIKHWVTPGQIYNQTVYPKEVLNLFDSRGFYIRDLALMQLASELLDNIGCEHYMFSMVDITNQDQYINDYSSEYYISDILPYYKEVLDKIKPSVHNVIFNYDWYSRPLTNTVKLKQLEENYNNVAGVDWPKFNEVVENSSLKNFNKKIIREIFNLNKWNWLDTHRKYTRFDLHPTPLEHLEYISKVLPQYSKISYDCFNQIKEIDSLVRKHINCFDESIKAKLKINNLNEHYPSRW